MTSNTKPLAVIILLGALTACGSHPSAPSNSKSAQLSAGVRFSQCMRNHGLVNFPDPDASGQLTIDGIANRSGVDTSSAAFTDALGACRALEPAGFTGQPRTAQQQDAALKFAQCVREHGVPDFPDPAKGEPLIDTNLIPSSDTPRGMSALNAATAKCGSLAAAAIRSLR